MRKWTADDPYSSVAGLLDPHRELVGFAGRTAELARLTAWSQDQDGHALQLVTGGAGVGKTRLAVEFASRLRALGWRVEWAGTEQATPDAQRAGRSLLIVDDADARIGLGELISERPGSLVLLIAAQSGSWLDQLELVNAQVGEAVRAARPGVVELGGQVDQDLTYADLVAAAAGAFAEALDLPAPAWQAGPPAEPDEQSMLEAHGTALTAVLGGTTSGAAPDSGTAMSELLGYEQLFWYAAARDRGVGGQAGAQLEHALRQVVAAGCLLGAATADDAAALARKAGQTLTGPVADWLAEIMPPEDGERSRLGVLKPKHLAELHVASELAQSPELASTCLTGLEANQAVSAIPLLARASSHAAQLPVSALRLASARLQSLRGPADALAVILNSLPYPSAGWADAGAELCAQICGQLDKDAEPALRAYWLNNLGARLWLAERRTDALSATEETVRLRRELAKTSPDRFTAALAGSLNNLGTQFFGLDRHSDAISAGEEALEPYRDLAAGDPGRYRPGLASSLSSAGIWYALAGRADDAIAVSEEAVRIRRDLATGEADRQRADLARSLSNLAVRYAELHRQDEAVQAEHEAVAIRRELAAEHPEDYASDLLKSLTKLAARYDENDRADEAAAASAELVAVRRKLAAAGPHEHLPELARALNSLAIKTARLGRGEESLDLHAEAVASYRQLEAIGPGRHLADLALSLNLLSARLVELDRSAQALTATQDAVAIRRQLAAADPEQHRSNLARSLRNLATLLDAQGHARDARTARKEAAKLAPS